MYEFDRISRITFDIAILSSVTATFAISIAYALQISKAPTLTTSPRPSRGSLIPAYGLTPVATITVIIFDICRYNMSKISHPLIYGVVYTTLTSAGWLGTTVIWTYCHISNNGYDHVFPTWSNVCYQKNVVTVYNDGYLSMPARWLGLFLIITSIITFILFLSYLAYTARDVYRSRRGYTSSTGHNGGSAANSEEVIVIPEWRRHKHEHVQRSESILFY